MLYTISRQYLGNLFTAGSPHKPKGSVKFGMYVKRFHFCKQTVLYKTKRNQNQKNKSAFVTLKVLYDMNKVINIKEVLEKC